MYHTNIFLSWSVMITCLTLTLGAEEPRLSVMSLNCYAFPVELTGNLRTISRQFGKEINLVSGITKTIQERIKGIAAFVKQQNPDVVVFQELWKDDNKKLMEKELRATYPYIYWVPYTTERQAKHFASSVEDVFKGVIRNPQSLIRSETYTALNPLKLDSGLFIASKFKLLEKAFLAYKDKAGDEVNAQKGALAVLFYDRSGTPVLLANTHLQSWRDLEYVTIRYKQMRQVGALLSRMRREWTEKLMKKVWLKYIVSNGKKNGAKKDFTLIVLGDMNDPLTYQKEPRRLIDRSTHLAAALQQEDIMVSNTEVVKILRERHNIAQYLEVRESQKDALLTTYYPSGNQATRLVRFASDALYPLIGRFYEKKDDKLLYDYFPEAQDTKGIQQLDHIFLDNKSKIKEYKVFRKEILGDTGPNAPYNPDSALSDHAAVMVELEP